MKRFGALALMCVLIISLLTGCVSVRQNDLPDVSLTGGDYGVSFAVLYDGENSSGTWEDTLSRLEQPLMLGITAEAVDVSEWSEGSASLEGYDIVYPDASVMTSGNAGLVRESIMSFVEGGGSAYLENSFYEFFPAEFFGAESFREVEEYPYHMEYPKVSGDLQDIQDVTESFYVLYEAYSEFPELEGLYRGVGMVPDTATTIASKDGLSLSAVNVWGEGYVFFCSGLLPNPYYTLGTSLENRTEAQRMLSDTALSTARLLESSFASFVSKRTVGYSVWRVFGSHGNPAMSWELHFEEQTGFDNGSGIQFAEMAREYNQIPSYTLIRNTYTWFLYAESVSSLLGQSEDAMSFVMDKDESAYSSGTHAAAGDEWLTQYEVSNGGSYFVDDTSYDQRAYPWLGDLDGDGVLDLLCGSADGKIYFYKGTSYDGRFTTEAGEVVADLALEEGGYSAPVVYDVDGDGEPDMLCGASDGNLYLFKGEGGLSFASPELWLETGLTGQALPDVGDLDGDGKADLVLGSNEHRLLVYYGESARRLKVGSASEISAYGVEGNWVAPCIADLDGDGVNDLALGTFDGYVARLINNGSGFDAAGYIELDEMNYKGNYNAKFGNNSVPRFADINGDGITDLLCGCLEYGMNYPIDSEYYSGRESLQEQLDYFKEHGYYVGVHFYTNSYASPERESYELERQLEAMQSYGLNTTGVGANQHTWYTSSHSPQQSFLSLWNKGILFNTGYGVSGDFNPVPQYSARNVISLPFYLTVDGERTILLQNCSTICYEGETWSDISARWDMPIAVYYHCDFTAGSPDAARANIETVQAFREKHGYSFVMENQLMYASAAAYNMTVDVDAEVSEDGHISMTLAAGAVNNLAAMYDGDYQTSTGARISLGEAIEGEVVTDADVWHVDGNNIYVSLNRPVSITSGEEAAENTHLTRVNLPAAISTTDTNATVQFKEGGMMECAVNGTAYTASEGWTAEAKESGETIFTCYSAEPSTLIITFGEE